MSRVLSADPLTQILRRFHYEEATGDAVIETVQDVTTLLDANKRAFNSFGKQAKWQGDWHQVASIPMNIYMELHRNGIAEDETAFRKWLNDRDQLAFRTRPGAV